MTAPVLQVDNLKKHFPVDSGLRSSKEIVHAVDGVSFSIAPGEVLGLVGESGSGKSTVGKCILRLLEPTAGTITLQGTDITRLPRRRVRPLRRKMHMVFQDPYSSLNPRMPIGRIVGEPLRMHNLVDGSQLERRVSELLEMVALRPELRHRYPHELSGGQRQRVAIARALSVQPPLLIADEPVSALDVSVQASILNLLKDLQAELGFSCLFVAHDLSTVEFLCDRVAVMYLGKIVEMAPRKELFVHPKHPYTQALLSAVPVPDAKAQRHRQRIVLTGDIPSPVAPPTGCSFHTRCPVVQERNRIEEPQLREISGQGHHLVACHLVGPNGEAPDITRETSHAQ
ncbi:ABC transporter ATP-binding protein [Qaidamihabitans albus]|uniref:ABC transporter ATP-binding protein n=1 Tax=Qaidamihabitans albus TaxID=2795733 RepID=UPI0018F119B8|nr:ABC transporter ATP-binding protein [Qaidamihabitans albus]